MAVVNIGRADLSGGRPFFMMGVSMMTWGQNLAPRTPAPDRATIISSSSLENNGSGVRDDVDYCLVHQVTGLPGSHKFAGDVIEAIAADPDPGSENPDAIGSLTADVSPRVPLSRRAMCISKSSDGGAP